MDMDGSRLLAADRNFAAAWGTLGRCAGFAVEQHQTVTLAASGLPTAAFNGAFVASPVADPHAAVERATEFFGSRSLPFMLWLRNGADDDLLRVARDAGLAEQSAGPPLMMLDDLDVVPPRLDVDIRFVDDEQGVETHRQVMAAGFGMPTSVTSHIIGDDLVSDPDVAIAIASVGGEPVATALLVVTDDTAGVYNVATLPAQCRKGYGAAVTWAVIAEGARHGCTHAALQSSAAGYEVYRRMGFLERGRFIQLTGPPG